MPADSTAKAARSPTARSRVSNGSHLGVGDGRSKWARRFKDLIELYTADLGDADTIGEMRRSMIRRAATLTVELEKAEAVFAEMGEADAEMLTAYQTQCNTLRRTLESLGLNRPGAAPTHKPLPADDARGTLTGRIEAIAGRMPSLTDVGLCVGDRKAQLDVARRIFHIVEKAKLTGEKIPLSVANLAVELAMAMRADEPDEEPEAPAELERKASVERGHDGPDGTVWDYPANANETNAKAKPEPAKAPAPEPKPEVHVPHATSRTLISVRALTGSPIPSTDGGIL